MLTGMALHEIKVEKLQTHSFISSVTRTTRAETVDSFSPHNVPGIRIDTIRPTGGHCSFFNKMNAPPLLMSLVTSTTLPRCGGSSISTESEISCRS